VSEDVPARRVPIRLIAIVFVGMFGMLALGYVMFLRPAYVPVFSNLRPADAAAVVAQLDAKSIAYRLGDGGTTITVPADQADQARLAIAGSDVALKGGVGFELFNKSDMGLTDFAQRINYQRALQGELERTIMMMDEVETARVHLAMPERALFRSERNPAKAAIELIAKPGRQLDGDRVAGIQRLVAFAVPDLAPADVVVLDGDGRVLSESSSEDAFLSPDAEEQQGVQRYYRARARAALEPAFPGLAMDVKVLVLGKSDAAPPTPAATPTPDAAKPAARSFRLRIIVATAAPLSQEQTATARGLVATAVGLDEASGDELAFEVGIGPSGATAGPPLPSAAASIAPTAARPPSDSAWSYWLVAIAVGIAALLLIVPRLAGPRPRLTREERDAMVDRIRAALGEPEALHAG
jgi:flagellar M-ring protein FliF